MSNRYEQSLKEQAARIRRELAGEKETKPVERPKKEEREDRFVLTDVPSPIYGFQRPKKQRSIQEEGISDESEVEVSSELKEEKTEESLVDATDETNETSEIETMEQTDSTEADAGLVPTTDSDLLVPEPIIEQVPEKRVEEIQPEIVHVAATEENEVRESETAFQVTDENAANISVTTIEETSEKLAEETVTPQADQVSIKKPIGPPVNVVMTTKDLMAMYRARREQNNLHGKK